MRGTTTKANAGCQCIPIQNGAATVFTVGGGLASMQ